VWWWWWWVRVKGWVGEGGEGVGREGTWWLGGAGLGA
jgi:hypothetical protein